jgi:hypothetical protein
MSITIGHKIAAFKQTVRSWMFGKIAAGLISGSGSHIFLKIGSPTPNLFISPTNVEQFEVEVKRIPN